jgi:hypothetical protein
MDYDKVLPESCHSTTFELMQASFDGCMCDGCIFLRREEGPEHACEACGDAYREFASTAHDQIRFCCKICQDRYFSDLAS